MIRQVVYHELSAERRAWLPEQVAEALETLATNQIDEQANILAFHYEHAGNYAAGALSVCSEITAYTSCSSPLSRNAPSPA